MIRWSIALALAGATPGWASAKDVTPEVLTHTGKWVVDYDRDGCHLYAQFGAGDALAIVRFTRYQPGDSFDLSVYGKRFRGSGPRVEAKADFGLADANVNKRALTGNAGELPVIVLGQQRLVGWQGSADTAPDVTPEQEAAVKDLTLSIRGRRPVRFEFRSLAKPFAQLRHCTTTLVESWGYDPQVQASLTRPATPATSAADWLRTDDFPIGAAMAGHNGLVQFRLDVDAEGKIAGCYVLARTNPDDFADTTCRAVSKRGKFEPALDAEGKPVRSFFIRKVHWQAR